MLPQPNVAGYVNGVVTMKPTWLLNPVRGTRFTRSFGELPKFLAVPRKGQPNATRARLAPSADRMWMKIFSAMNHWRKLLELAAPQKAVALGSGYGFKLLFASISHDGHRQRLEPVPHFPGGPLKCFASRLRKRVVCARRPYRLGSKVDALSVSGLEQSVLPTRIQCPGAAGLNIGEVDDLPLFAFG